MFINVGVFFLKLILVHCAVCIGGVDDTLLHTLIFSSFTVGDVLALFSCCALCFATALKSPT